MNEAYIKEKFRLATGHDPYAYQWQEAWPAIVRGRNTLISAGTGSGKTEAVIVPALETGKRLILLYPTKALLQDQLERIQRLAPSYDIAIDTGDQDDLSCYHADIILTNLDKFLYRLFGYGKKRFGYLFPYQIAGLSDDRAPLLIFDEAHAYEENIFSHFWFVLKKLTYERRVQTILLSATLPPNFVDALRDSQCRYFPRPADEGDFFHVVEDREIRTGKVHFAGSISPGEDAVAQAWQAYEEGKRVIMVVRRVVKPDDDDDKTGSTLHEVWESLLKRASAAERRQEIARSEGDRVTGTILTYHGHQMSAYRRPVLKRLKKLDDAKQPYLLLTTSAMEVGVDVSCDLMITDLCEPDSFVQRIGRCARRKGENGQVIIVEAHPAPPRTVTLHDYLQRMPAGSELDANRKVEINAMNTPPTLDTVHLRLEYVQDTALHRYIYDFVQENKAIWEQGLLITREWEPSVAIVRSEKRNGDTYIGGIPDREFWRGKELKEKTLLPVSCAADIAPFCAWILDTFNDEFHQPQRVPVGGKHQRSLKEALSEVGYSAGNDENISKPLYAVGFPLILLLGSEVAGEVFQDDNFGFAYSHRFAATTVKLPPQLRDILRVRQVELWKDKGQVRLPLYWYEPIKRGGE